MPVNTTLRLLFSFLLVFLVACNPATESDDDENGETAEGDGGNGGGNGGGDSSETVELAYGVGFLVLFEPSPTQIALDGYATHLIPSQSRFSVQVVDKDLNPVAGRDVRFQLTDTTGSPELTETTASTNADGEASTIIKSGTVQGTTQIEVYMDLVDASGSLIEADVLVATSLPISMHTAAPVTDGIGLSADVFNPEGYNFNGVPVQITVHLNDMHRNPVADGTLVNFLASAGTVEPTCVTENGSCTLQWWSSPPKGDGRVDILARTNGNDAFEDTNGNSRFDIGETYAPQGEPYVDTDGTGDYTPGDFFWDLSGTGDWVDADPGANYRGNGCTEAARDHGHCAERAVVFSNIVLVMSGSSVVLDNPNLAVNVDETVMYEMVDQNGSVPPVGSTFDIECTDGTEAETRLDEVNARPSELFSAWSVYVTFSGDPGSCNVVVQSPNGLPSDPVEVSVTTP